ncbi:phosphomannomutase/phosphoglucomutase [Candidatus Woesearchaeota archaeon]|nr:phosphomannomutase/phosphoglucomutase [Candidatus Woesearchaeota archaeon]
MLSQIFKAYDVRGIYNENLTEEIAYNIGKAFVSFLKCKAVVVGYDMRISSPTLSKAFMDGANQQGADSIDIGLVSTDGLYFASGFLKKPAVMFTASHNPQQYNGIKFCKENAVPINQDTGLQKIKRIIEKENYEKIKAKAGKIIKKDILAEYVKHVKKFIDVDKLGKLKIAVDAGNGMAGKIIPLAYDNLPIEIIPLYFKLDGTFPNHPADPSKYENLKELQSTVKKEKYDFGMAFDGDADRIFFVDENGRIINSSLISSLVIKRILKKHGNEKIIYNLICSKVVPETIKKYHGKALIERVGHSFIKDSMRKTNAVFACEHSAHYYFRDNFHADSGIIASLIVSEIISKENKSLSSLLKEFEKYHKIEETNFEVKDKDKKLKEIEKIYKKQNLKSISKLDGITFDFGNWWFNVRPSNTEPLLRLNLEADTQKLMEEKKKELVRIIRSS